MAKSITPSPLISQAWSQRLQLVSEKVAELRQQHLPENQQAVTNCLWAKWLRKNILGGKK